MNRRDFVRNGAGLFVFLSPILPLVVWAAEGETDEMLKLRVDNVAKSCQSDPKDDERAIVAQISAGEAGLLMHSIGCRAPHKHVLFVPLKYVLDPATMPLDQGKDFKTFQTSNSYDLSFLVKHTVGIHSHE